MDAMVMQKPSKSMDIDPIIMIFAIYGSLTHTILHAKNEGNLPCGFRMATAYALKTPVTHSYQFPPRVSSLAGTRLAEVNGTSK